MFRKGAADTADCCYSSNATAPNQTNTVNVDALITPVDVDATEQATITVTSGQATICSQDEKCQFYEITAENQDKWMAWNVWVEDLEASIMFKFTKQIRPETRGRNRNRNKKKNKNKNKNRGRNRVKQRELCPAGWMMIVEGDPKQPNPHVILQKTCLSDLAEDFNIRAYSNRVQVYLINGTMADFRLTAESLTPTPPSLCLWDCKWKKNPVFQETTFWRIGDDTKCGSIDPAMCVRIRLNVPEIPVDLTCLDDCFSNVPREVYKRKCENEDYEGGRSDDADIDCLLFNRKSESQDRTDAFPIKLIDSMAGRLTVERQVPSGHHRVAAADSVSDLFRDFIPNEPMDNALMFCIMANLDAQQQLPLPGQPGEIGLLDVDGDGELKAIWENKNCSAFLPRLDWRSIVPVPVDATGPNTGRSQRGTLSTSRRGKSSGSKRKGPNTRSSGPASAIIER